MQIAFLGPIYMIKHCLRHLFNANYLGKMVNPKVYLSLWSREIWLVCLVICCQVHYQPQALMWKTKHRICLVNRHSLQGTVQLCWQSLRSGQKMKFHDLGWWLSTFFLFFSQTYSFYSVTFHKKLKDYSKV